MQNPRHLLLTCAVAACLTPTLSPAADNEAQIRARQALEEKMSQLPPVTAPTNPAPAVSKPKATAAKPVPVQAATPSNDDATRQKLRDALNQTASQPKPAAVQPPVQQPPAVTVAPSTTTVESQPVQSTPSYISAPSNDDATNQKLQEALRQKMQQTPAEPTAPAVATQKPQKPAKLVKPAAPVKPAPTANYATQPAPTAAPAANYAPVPTTSGAHPNLPEQPTPQPTPAPVASRNQPAAAPTMSLPTLTGPATGLSSAKQQKLDELLNQYRADQITPQQYHEQRAKILAEP